MRCLVTTNKYWGSGDGVQITTLTFPDDFDLSILGLSEYDWDDASVEDIYAGLDV